LRHPGQDPCHNQQTDPVSNPVSIDLLTDPHQEHSPCGHRDGSHDLVIQTLVTIQNQAVSGAKATSQRSDPEEALHQTDHNGGITCIFINLLPACFSFFLESLEGRIDRAHQLEDNGSRNIWHNAQTKDGTLADIRSGKQGNDLDNLSDATLLAL